MNSHTVRFAGLAIFALQLSVSALADWPMPGHDVRRTSHSADPVQPPTRALWHKKMDALIPSRSQIITLEASSGSPAMVLVTAADGIHSLDPDTGAERWLYAMDMPPGDAPSVEGRLAFVAGTDGTIHAVQTADGRRVWRTDRAGAPFYANPLVGDGRVCAGARDGVFYCFDKFDGKLLWFKRTDAPISYSAAYQTYPDEPNGVYFFASQDRCAYALRAETGEEIWRTCDLPGSTFIAYWPVVTGERVLFVSASNYPTDDQQDLGALQREGVLVEEGELEARKDPLGRIRVDHHIAWLEAHPERRSVLVLDRKTGAQAEITPFLWWGNPGGQRYPPAVDPDGLIWAPTPWLKTWFGTGRFAGWRLGDNSIRAIPLNSAYWESADEPSAYSIVGRNIYQNAGGDGGDFGSVFSPNQDGPLAEWSIAVFYAAFGDYWGRWAERRYGNGLSVENPSSAFGNTVGWHGHQNPPVPLRGKVYFHRSNAVICMGR